MVSSAPAGSLRPWIAAWLVASPLAGLAGWLLPWRFDGFGVKPPTTPLLGEHAVVASAWFAGLLATVGITQARARRDERAAGR